MMSAVNFDRDLRHLTLGQFLPVPVQSNGSDNHTTSNGVVYRNSGAAYMPESLVAFSNNHYIICGLHIDAPEKFRAGVYRIKADWYTSSEDVLSSFIVGISDSVPSSGSPVFHPHAFKLRSGGDSMSIDETIRLPNPLTIDAVDYSDRSLFFGVKFDKQGGADSRYVQMSLSVQNLMLKNPPYEAAVR